MPSTAEAISNTVSDHWHSDATSMRESSSRRSSTNHDADATHSPDKRLTLLSMSSLPLKPPASPRSPSDVRKTVLDRTLDSKLIRQRSSRSGLGISGDRIENILMPFGQQNSVMEPKKNDRDREDDDSTTPTATPQKPKLSNSAPVSPAVASPEPTTLRNSQSQLNKYREQLARDLSARGENVRVSPIQEESTMHSSPAIASSISSSDLATGSTESGKTIRGTPMPSCFSAAATPSYPFPRMNTPGQLSAALGHPFPALSPAVYGSSRPHFGPFKSGNSTPGSVMTFQPEGSSHSVEDSGFSTPSLYEMSLMLTAEPGLDAWWNTVVQIMTEVYRAERVSLAVPADPTDIENVPWGQRATYNLRQDDELSIGYMARSSDPFPTSSSEGAPELIRTAMPITPRNETLRRPGLLSRHSFTRFEDEKDKTNALRVHQNSRPTYLSRSKSYFPILHSKEEDSSAPSVANLNRAALAEHDAAEPLQKPLWEGFMHGDLKENKARVHSVLQAFDLEADPLIDGSGVNRVLERGTVICLTRSYPYLTNGSQDENEKYKSAARVEEKRKFKKPRADSTTVKLSTILSSATREKSGRRPSVDQSGIDDAADSNSPKYEEYEQPPPSPWTQSPAPSPAVRPDPTENPFFTDASVDEGSFNPSDTVETYQRMRPPEAIGMDNSWSVLHIPLPHLTLSKRFSPNSFKLDSAVVEAKTTREGSRKSRGNPSSLSQSASPPRRDKQVPIAILSILCPLIPYPANLRHSLEHLAPHLATSFSLARHHSMLEDELAGLHRKSKGRAGFGGVDADGRQIVNPIAFSETDLPQPEDLISQHSLGTSITSPSEYSAPAISSSASPGLTPGWETPLLSHILERRISGLSPSPTTSDGYFGAKSTLGKYHITSFDISLAASKRGTTDVSERRHTRNSTKPSPQDTHVDRPVGAEQLPTLSSKTSPGEAVRQSTVRIEIPSTLKDDSQEGKDGLGDEIMPKSAQPVKRRTLPDPSATKHHTQLHSYGADFSMSGQSLPPGLARSAAAPGILPRTTSSVQLGRSGQTDVPPPSYGLRSIILDLLPLQLFIARPHTGEIAWVNSRFLSYRGQTTQNFKNDPYSAIHPEDRPDYLKKWAQCVRAGTSLETDTLVRIKRFDGQYRLFAVRAVPIRDRRGVLLQYLGSFMDVHKQYMAEMEAKTKAELEASEAKHRLLANLIPQIIFTATEHEGITFANEQWLSYTGQGFDDALGLGFVDYVHPDDLARCRIPSGQGQSLASSKKSPDTDRWPENASGSTTTHMSSPDETPLRQSKRQQKNSLARTDTAVSGTSVFDIPSTELAELAKKGVIKVSRDSTGRRSYTTEIRLRSKNDEYRWHLVRCVEIDNVDFGNGASSYFGSATDINDHKLLETKLKEAMESKGRFLSNMSHEIRTPLIGISGMVSFLQDTTLNEEQRDYTNTIQTSAKSLLLIINDILDLSKVDAGMMKLSFEWFHTRSLIEDVNELVWTMAVSKGLELNYVVEQDVPSWIKGDRVRIRQVLLNVIGNAIKFTSKGEVFSHCRVYSGVETLEADEIMLEFSIIDTGRGFTKEEAEMIFKPFSQIDGSSTRQHGGSGLGLVISRQLVELHGGEMDGTAILGEGSTFTFTAKFNLPSDQDQPEMPVTPQQVPLQQGLPLLEASSIKQVKSLEESTGHTSGEVDIASPPTTLASSGSSDPSLNSGGIRSPTTARSSVSSVNAGLARFGEAARASGQDLSQMKLEMPMTRGSPGMTPTPESSSKHVQFRMYSILIISPQKYSRQAIKMHIEMTIPQDVPSQITCLESIKAARSLLGGEDPVLFTHVVLNLSADDDAMNMLDTVMESPRGSNTTVLFLTDSKQRQSILKATHALKYRQAVSENRVLLIPKPAKPFRFAVIFDPAKERDLSFDHNRSRALQIVESQKQTYLEAERRMGNKGHKVLLVEDNLVNQKVLLKYLLRIGLDVEVASDGVEATEKVFSHDYDYYSIILVCPTRE